MDGMNGENFWSFLFASQMGGWGYGGLGRGIRKASNRRHTLCHIPGTPLCVAFTPRAWYGFLWHAFMMFISFVGSLGDALWFQKPTPIKVQISALILHKVLGGVRGFLYNPEKKEV